MGLILNVARVIDGDGVKFTAQDPTIPLVGIQILRISLLRLVAERTAPWLEQTLDKG